MPKEFEPKEMRWGPVNKQITDTLLMVRPDYFGFNEQTADSNAFQNRVDDAASEVRQNAMSEFTGMVDILEGEGMNVVVIPSPVGTPDAVFPNNWISFHDSGAVILYPMRTPNRRAERQLDVVRDALRGMVNFNEVLVIDFTDLEKEGKFLEGTGSLVLDRKQNVAFAVESPRTSMEALDAFCNRMDMQAIKFHAVDRDGKPIYHTNVVMGIGDGFSVVCLDAIKDEDEMKLVTEKLSDVGVIIPITLDQMNAFCGNILHVQSVKGEKKIIMSKTSFDAFRADQREILATFGKLLPVNIPTIETVGGGSARCMVAEVRAPIVSAR